MLRDVFHFMYSTAVVSQLYIICSLYLQTWHVQRSWGDYQSNVSGVLVGWRQTVEVSLSGVWLFEQWITFLSELSCLTLTCSQVAVFLFQLTTSHSNLTSLGAFFWPGPGPARPFFFDDRPGPAMLASVLFYQPERPKVAWPLSSAVIGHAHVPRFSCLHKWHRQAMCKVKWLFLVNY